MHGAIENGEATRLDHQPMIPNGDAGRYDAAPTVQTHCLDNSYCYDPKRYYYSPPMKRTSHYQQDMQAVIENRDATQLDHQPMIPNGDAGRYDALPAVQTHCINDSYLYDPKKYYKTPSNQRRSHYHQGSPVPEKPGTVTVVPGPPVANMYSAPPENKLYKEELTPTPSVSLGRAFPDLTPTPDELSKARAASTLNRLSDESQQTFLPDPDVTGGLGYMPFVDYGGQDYAPVANGRRSSLTDPYSTPILQRNSGATSDFCTIRRGTRAADLAPLVDPISRDIRDVLVSPRSPLGQHYTEAPTLRRQDLRHNDMHSIRYTDSPLLHGHNDVSGIFAHDTGSMLGADPTSTLPPLRANGSAATLARHSASYGRSNSYGSPPPPPYQRGNGRSPKGAAISPTASGQQPLILSNLGEPGSPDAQYIFSPEAMMKPGTLV